VEGLDREWDGTPSAILRPPGPPRPMVGERAGECTQFRPAQPDPEPPQAQGAPPYSNKEWARLPIRPGVGRLLLD